MDALNISRLTAAASELQSLAPVVFAPIETEEDNERALEVLEVLMHEVGEQKNHPLEPLVTSLVERIQAFEDAHYPTLPNDPARMLAYLIDLRGISQRELSEATGIDQGNISRLLAKKREFTPDQMRRLATYFKVDPSLFL